MCSGGYDINFHEFYGVVCNYEICTHKYGYESIPCS